MKILLRPDGKSLASTDYLEVGQTVTSTSRYWSHPANTDILSIDEANDLIVNNSGGRKAQ